MLLPSARGPLGSQVFARLRGPVENAPPLEAVDPDVVDGASGADAALTLWALHELHYRGFDDVDERWEWAPALMGVRASLEADLERRLRERWATYDAFERPEHTGDLSHDLFALVDSHDGPSLAEHVQLRASRAEVLALLRQRSLYHLKEADPTSWVVPRLEAGPKAALMEIQFDEYGAGRPDRLHHRLFERGLTDAGLDATYGAYVDEATTEVLEQNNALSLFGLHRRLRGAAMGHLAAFEATSSLPSKKMVRGLERVGLTGALVDYYAEHVIADAVHDQLAVRAVCAAMVADEPGLADDVFLGAFTCLDLEARTAQRLLAGTEATGEAVA